MKRDILEEMKKKGITRLCHFTKSKILPQILNNFNGILATDTIPEYYRETNDKNRYDGKSNYVCCSVEYPNVYYLDRIIDVDRFFTEWVIICIDISIILDSEVLFSKVNAATERGRYIQGGINGFRQMFNEQVGTSKRMLTRNKYLPSYCTTDIQAEIMILNKIDKRYIKGIIVPTKEQAKREKIRMDLLGIDDDIEIRVCNPIFRRNLAENLQLGKIPKELIYNGDKTSF